MVAKCYHIDDETAVRDYFACVEGNNGRMYMNSAEFEEIARRFPRYADSGVLSPEEVEALAKEGEELSIVAVLKGIRDWDEVSGAHYPAFSNDAHLIIGENTVILIVEDKAYIAGR